MIRTICKSRKVEQICKVLVKGEVIFVEDFSYVNIVN